MLSMKGLVMKPLYLTAAVAIVIAAGIGAAALTPAFAQRSDKDSAKTPEGWSYEIKNGRRVPRGNRTTNADGSWREEVRDGNCTTVRTMSASGEYRESRQC